MIATDILKFVDLHMHHSWNHQIFFSETEVCLSYILPW